LDEVERTMTLTREAASGERVQFGLLPELRVRIESRILPGNIGYLAFNAFMPPVMRELPSRLRELRDTRGLIIDLRENIGGIGLMAGGVAGYLLPRETPLGIMRLRDGTFGIVAYPQQPQYAKPVVVLVDEFSVSTAEILAAGLAGDQTRGHRRSPNARQGVAVQNRRAAARGLPAVRAGGLRDGGQAAT
jgi:carboxyl-terminal processing protease